MQNTFPEWIGGTKSYIEWPQWKYHRLKGYTSVKTGDIVVFNFPAGDTVALKVQNPDYYTLVKLYGRDVVWNNKSDFGDVVYRPVDRRENYVKRCVGLPGERLKIVDGEIYINGKKQAMPADAQFMYIFQSMRRFSDSDWENLGIAVDDRTMVMVSPEEAEYWRMAGFQINDDGTSLPIYRVPMTQAMVDKLKADNSITQLMREPAAKGEFLFPEGISSNWTRSDYGELWIPKKGASVRLNAQNWPIYERIIRNYEYHTDSYVKDGIVYVDGKPADTYTFAMDYYFMMGDNRDCSLDSRYWGFVPEDHIVGTPMRVLISFDKDKSIFNGGIRWNRILKNANSGL